MGIGVSFFTEGVGAGPRKHMDILGLSMNDGADLRVHPSGKAVVSISAQTQGQGHETTFAQIVAEELGIPPEDVEVRHGDTDKSPYGLGTYGSRSTPVSGGAVAVVSRKVRDKARLIAATMLETRPEDLAWEKGRWYVKGDPEKGAMIEEIAERAYSGEPMPEGMEGGLDAQVIYDPPNLTYPYGAYIAVVDIDPDTAQVTVRRFIAVDDCGVRINPMVVDGQIHGGLAEGVGIALMELITFDEEGNCLNSSFMDYLIPTALECPDFELGETVTPCPHHPLGAKGVGESPNVGSPPAIVNAVIDALHETHGVSTSTCPAPRRASGPRCRGGPSRRNDRRGPVPAGAGARRPGRAVRDRDGGARAAPDQRRAGNVALVLADGTIEGFVGGVCAEHSVRAYALQALETGEPMLLRILPRRGPAEAASREEGAVTVANHCLSGGAIEVFLEPALPAPRVLVAGDSPIVAALPALGADVGLEVVVARTSRTACSPPRADDLALVVAAHGSDEWRPCARASRRASAGWGWWRAPSAAPGSWRSCARRAWRRSCSTDSRHRPGSTSAPARRPRSRCRSWPGSSRCAGRPTGPRSGVSSRDATGDPAGEIAHLVPDVEALAQRLAGVDYLVDEGLATSLFLSLRLPQPLLLEGEAGVGKTEAGKSLAAVLDTPLIRLQCYDGIDAAEALYEWNYPRQLLSIRLADASGTQISEEELFGTDYLIRRPLLRALEHPGPRPAVLLIDEIDRADDDFEAFLLELLADAAVTIPEIGTVGRSILR